MKAAAVALIALAATGCATSSVTLLPGEDGHAVGSIAVLETNREVVLDRPLTAGTLSTGPARVRSVKAVKPEYGQLLASLPPAPARFVLTFVQGTSEITAGSRPTLDSIRREIAARPGAAVEVVGHTDTVGSADDNDRLSQQRADEVVKVLLGEGFAADLLSAVGRGERELAIPTVDNVANEQNRRVEVVVR